MKFLYIIDEPRSLNPATDTTLALIDESMARGYENFACELQDLSIVGGKTHVFATPCRFREGLSLGHLYDGEPRLLSLDEFRVVFMRKDPPVDEHYVTALHLLNAHDPKKTLVVNNPQSLLTVNEKIFALTLLKEFVPDTIISANAMQIRLFAEQHGRVVLKPLFGFGGQGVLSFSNDHESFSSALAMLTSEGKVPILVQRFIDNAVQQGDKRVILLNGEPLGAVLRKAKSGDFRANFHAGGSVEASAITTSDLAIIARLKPLLMDLGLYFVGIDIINSYLTEVNVTSPTCLRHVEHFEGTKRLRKDVINCVESLIDAR